MKEQKSNEQQIYRVRVYKDFDFPSFSIDHRRKLEDLAYNAIEEMKESSHRGENLNVEVINVLPFSLKIPEEVIQKEKQRSGDLNFFIREVALNETQIKFGELNFDKNPSLFTKVSDKTISVRFRVNPEIEEFFVDKIQNLSMLFENKIVRQ